ncbi:MAG: hypothetical protein ACR2H9_11265 [Longimicrobiaceae bacterium]
MRIYPARHPNALNARHPILIEEMLNLKKAGKRRAVSTIIEMVRDLQEHGRKSRYLVAMQGFPIYELKPRSRGGEKGGTRVYLFLTEHDEAGLVTCEVKDGDSPDPVKLKTTVQVAVAHKQGIPVLQKRR